MVCFYSNFEIIFVCTSRIEVTTVAPFSLTWTMLPSPFNPSMHISFPNQTIFENVLFSFF